jgi:hypothetical protein
LTVEGIPGCTHGQLARRDVARSQHPVEPGPNFSRHRLLLGILKMSVRVSNGEGPVSHLGAAKAERQKATQLRHRSVCLVIEEADVRRHLCPTERSFVVGVPFAWAAA